MKCTQGDAYDLFHKGTLALADVEQNGIRIDVEHLQRATKETRSVIDNLQQQLKKDPVWTLWKEVYKDEANLTSHSQLADVLFNHLGYPVTMWTKGGKKGKPLPSTEEIHLKTIDLPFISTYIEMAKMEKVAGTYLAGISRELDSNGFLHPVFNLSSGSDIEEKGGAKSYRSSSSLPNFQNMPIRNKKQGEIIRKCFIPREGNVILEVDYSAIEVALAACYHKDRAMISYIEDTKKDLHKEMAEQCYMLDFSGWTKDQYKNLRYCSKNKFVFPQFYGSAAFQCAPALWEAIDVMNLRTPDVGGHCGISVKEHLANNGINCLGTCDPRKKPKVGTYEYHISKVEKDFWEKRFPQYAKWKKDWYRQYQKNGYFDLLTGFRIEGYYEKNKVINLPVQGVAFHCLLWSLIQLNEILKKKGYKALIVGQIHDSILFDMPPEEVPILLPVIKRVMTEKIRKVWDWIIVPLRIEAEVTPVNGSWATKVVIAT